MNNLKKLLKNRILYLALLLIAVMLLLVVRLFVLQIKNNDTHSGEAAKFTEYKLPLDAPRGNIYDRNGVLLAGNRESYKIYMINVEDDQDKRDKMYLELVSVFEKNNDVYENFLGDYLLYPPAWGKKIDEEDEAADKKAFVNDLVNSKADKVFFETPQGAFNYIRTNVFDIADEYTDYEAYKIMILRYQTYTYGLDSLRPSVIASDVCKATIDEITARSREFPGVSSELTYVRYYVNNISLGPVLGYVRAISEEEYEEKQYEGYFNDDVIGKLGVEKYYEDYLRGVRGYRKYVKKANGEVYEAEYKAPVPGDDLYLTIDILLQQTLYESIEYNVKYTASRANGVDNFGDCNAGAGVVSDVNTGEIIAMASYPGFDNNIFVAPKTDEKAQAAISALFTDPDSPSLNRCTQGTYPIGSMIKPAIAVAALETGVTDAKRIIRCPGYIIVSGKRMKCLSYHHDVSLVNALGRSCNIYFATVGIDAGIDNVDKWIKAFGLGENTGVEIAEKKGFRSNPETMDIFEAGTFHKWTDASTAATCIGQLYTTFTPLQVNRYTAAVANGGTLHNMHVSKTVADHKGTVIYEMPVESTQIGAKESTMKLVKEAMTKMIDAYAELQAQLTAYPHYFLAGKTGTAQTGTNEQSSHGFYTGFAPYNDPQIAITLMLEHGVYSGNNFPTVGDVIDCYFGGSYEPGFKGLTHHYDRDPSTTDGGQRLGKWFERTGPVI